jgi:hypothetical protein
LTKKSTRATEPPGSEAEASISTGWPTPKTDPLAGLLMTTVGGWFGATTVIVPTIPRKTCGVQ